MSYWRIHIPKRVARGLKKLPQEDRKRILKVLHEFTANPWHGDIVKVQGEKGLWRKRVGSYRIFYSPHNEDQLVEIKEIERRTSKTY